MIRVRSVVIGKEGSGIEVNKLMGKDEGQRRFGKDAQHTLDFNQIKTAFDNWNAKHESFKSIPESMLRKGKALSGSLFLTLILMN